MPAASLRAAARVRGCARLSSREAGTRPRGACRRRSPHGTSTCGPTARAAGGRGTVKQGEEIFQERCASCHGEFGEGAGRWPVLAGGQGSLTRGPARQDHRLVLAVCSPPLFDYVKRAMPFGNAQSLTDDETYALVAYVLNLNDVVKDDISSSTTRTSRPSSCRTQPRSTTTIAKPPRSSSGTVIPA